MSLVQSCGTIYSCEYEFYAQEMTYCDEFAPNPPRLLRESTKAGCLSIADGEDGLAGEINSFLVKESIPTIKPVLLHYLILLRRRSS